MSPSIHSIHSIHSIQEVIKAYQSHFVPEIEVYSQLYEDSKLRTGVALVKSSGTRYDGTSSFHMWIDPRFHGSPAENIGRSMGDPWEIHGCWIPFEGQRFGKDGKMVLGHDAFQMCPDCFLLPKLPLHPAQLGIR